MPIDKNLLQTSVDRALKQSIDHPDKEGKEREKAEDMELVKIGEYLGLTPTEQLKYPATTQKVEQIIRAAKHEYGIKSWRPETKTPTSDQVVQELKETINSYRRQLFERGDYTFEQLNPGAARFEEVDDVHSVTSAVEMAIQEYKRVTEGKHAAGLLHKMSAAITWRSDTDLAFIAQLQELLSTHSKNPTASDAALAEAIQNRNTIKPLSALFEKCLKGQKLIQQDGQPTTLLSQSLPPPAPADAAAPAPQRK